MKYILPLFDGKGTQGLLIGAANQPPSQMFHLAWTTAIWITAGTAPATHTIRRLDMTVIIFFETHTVYSLPLTDGIKGYRFLQVSVRLELGSFAA